ncbi:uncharacterized protein Dana_GF14300, isoform A [Drosophila ananassae]|uniref:Uncharacterized protein, isoform A n=1 Tax=Drosophila ananassae TaxID=7217 RepID=B3MMM9_DROAN|nr:uncharacterized protein LOC6497128 [Drosophila ananassae]EDV31920.1 uncharacterized protein Dana_GF14300, isoform A [Drosophila ananassae]
MPFNKPPEISFPIHNSHFNKTMANVKVACVLALTAPLLLYAFRNVPHKRKYKYFYSHYDPLDAFDRMMNGGYLESCPPGSGGKKDKDKDKDKKKKK